MAYMIPYYIADQGQPSPVLRYIWDEDPVSHFQHDPSELLEKIENTTIRAKIALCIGIYEWIIWRYHRLTNDVTPFQIAEAAWCSNIHDIYIEYYELDPKEYLGPVLDPLYMSMMWMGTVLFNTAENKDEWEIPNHMCS
ncbi:MAG: hypothetical protein FWG14_10020 [Peptococcaceae bacterium]|nr:hypothetical protein [Peptococcaceae bacterium]